MNSISEKAIEILQTDSPENTASISLLVLTDDGMYNVHNLYRTDEEKDTLTAVTLHYARTLIQEQAMWGAAQQQTEAWTPSMPGAIKIH